MIIIINAFTDVRSTIIIMQHFFSQRGVENRTEKVKKALGSKMTQEVERALHHANTIAEVEEVVSEI